MTRFPQRIALVLVAHAAAAPAAHAWQANANPGIDVRLSALRSVDALGRAGTFPDGLNGIALETTVCNEGTLEVPWFEPMNPNHPMIAFLAAAEIGGRLVQISNRCYVKHGFFAANGNSCGTPCMPPSGGIGDYLGVGCSDTYATSNNGDNYYLGPPEEIDPWLGTWGRFCSLFDRSEPPIAAPGDCDGRRSLSRGEASALGPVHSRVQVSDADLIAAGTVYCAAQYIVAGLPEAARDDSFGSRVFSANWNGNRWGFQPASPLLPGTVLQRWSGAEVSSGLHGAEDGRVFVAVKVSGPVDGFWHYEYALHNRDHAQGIGEVSLPLCAGARVRAFGFRDVDADAQNDWSAGLQNGELVIGGPGVLAWNTIANFWFDSDAAPNDGALGLGSRPGARSFSISTKVPSALYNLHLGPGCALDTPPTLFAEGTPARAELGNATFALVSAGNEPTQPNFLFFGFKAGVRSAQGCLGWTGTGAAFLGSTVTSDGNGVARHQLPVPQSLALEGLELRFQAVGRVQRPGRIFANHELSEGLLVRVGNQLSGCP